MDFDFYTLRIFSQVIKDNGFSKAAKSLGLTQPSVSQQIAKMEEQLGAKLFERVGHDIFLTDTGTELHRFSTELLEKGEQFLDQIHQSKSNPSGVVRYAMPESCQWTPHYRKIMSQIKDFPKITFEIGILPSEQIIQNLLESKIDFGFIVGERLNPELRFEKFADEHYSAVAAHPILLKPFESEDLKSLRLVSYPGWELFFSTWAKNHGLWKQAKERLVTPTVKIGTLAGAIHATQEGAGVAILPTHCIQNEIKTKKLHTFAKQSKASTNPIYIVKRIGDLLPKRSQVVLDLLRQAKLDVG